ncbi:uncharacterized protein LOC110073295 [Pogona vitticeps]
MLLFGAAGGRGVGSGWAGLVRRAWLRGAPPGGVAWPFKNLPRVPARGRRDWLADGAPGGHPAILPGGSRGTMTRPPLPLCGSILITGSNRGIGLGLVRGLLAASPPPDLVLATCRYPEKAQELQQLRKQYDNIRVLQLDVVSEKSIKAVVKEVEDLVGEKGLNCLVNNAGINVCATLDEVTSETMLTVYETNTVAQLMVTKAFLPLLRKAAKDGTGMGCHRASIINVSSESGSIQLVDAKKLYLQVYPYRIAKTALNMVTKCLAADLKSDGILCISLHPGWIQTDMGGEMAPLKIQDTIPEILSMLARLREEHNGSFLDWQGETVPW